MAYQTPIRVVVAHQQALIHAGLEALLVGQPDVTLLRVPYEQFSPARIWALAEELSAEVIVLDYEHGIQMAEGTTPVIAARGPRLLIVGNHDSEWHVRQALKRGVHGYALTQCNSDELALAVRGVARGGRHLCGVVANKVADSLLCDDLTGRETEVLQLLVQGLCNKSISASLNISHGTVKSHIKAIFNKLHVGSRTQAVAEVTRRGLLPVLASEPSTDAFGLRGRGAAGEFAVASSVRADLIS